MMARKRAAGRRAPTPPARVSLKDFTLEQRRERATILRRASRANYTAQKKRRIREKNRAYARRMKEANRPLASSTNAERCKRTFKMNCKAKLPLSANKEKNGLLIKEVKLEQMDHPGIETLLDGRLSIELRLLTVVQLAEIHELLISKVPAKKIIQQINSKYGTSMAPRDVYNHRRRWKNEQASKFTEANPECYHQVPSLPNHAVEEPKCELLSDFDDVEVVFDRVLEVEELEPSLSPSEETVSIETEFNYDDEELARTLLPRQQDTPSSKLNSSDHPTIKTHMSHIIPIPNPTEGENNPSLRLPNLIPSPIEVLSDSDAVRLVAHKLKFLSREQRIHAKKLICDVLDEAELGCLSRNSVLVTEQFPQH